jgi:hypothetical protein
MRIPFGQIMVLATVMLIISGSASASSATLTTEGTSSSVRYSEAIQTHARENSRKLDLAHVSKKRHHKRHKKREIEEAWKEDELADISEEGVNEI